MCRLQLWLACCDEAYMVEIDIDWNVYRPLSLPLHNSISINTCYCTAASQCLIAIINA